MISSRETGAKTTRARPVASQIEAGNVTLVRANWNHAFIEELRDFPFGRKDDQVDALSRAFDMLLDIRHSDAEPYDPIHKPIIPQVQACRLTLHKGCDVRYNLQSYPSRPGLFAANSGA